MTFDLQNPITSSLSSGGRLWQISRGVRPPPPERPESKRYSLGDGARQRAVGSHSHSHLGADVQVLPPDDDHGASGPRALRGLQGQQLRDLSEGRQRVRVNHARPRGGNLFSPL